MPPSGLHGRTTELAWLRSLWDAATARDASGRFTGGPRMAVIAAETGYGKTRLVQALYQQLTEDPSWDPAEINYWPDAFQAPGEQLRVNPDPEGHVPKGPPQFLWLGMRWQPTDVRNVEERACALPAARDALQVHVAIADRYRPAWQHARAELARSVRRGGIVSSLARAADLAVPFGELGVRLAKGAADLARDRASTRRDAGAEREQQSSDASDEFLAELREVFGGAGSAGRVLPTVLWLDDAQWIDGTTLRFVQELWQEAHRRSWPLLVAVTHWEREWEELRAAGDGLAAFEGEPGVEVLRLSGSARNDLAGYLAERLPGITAAQRELLLDKAGGNFLTMVENVGELLAHSEAFVGGSLDGALTPDGERFVQEWESDRQRRIEQRFSRLASEVRTVLGWGSVLGIRFLKDVIADHAVRTGLTKDPDLLIDACVTPFAILGTPSANVREFRDRAFHVVARRHFDRWGASHATSLHATLREHLARWVNASFDDSGGILRERDEPDWEPPEGAAIFLAPEERRDLLGMAVRELELPAQPDWSDPLHRATLRARVLMTWTDEFEGLYDRVRQTALGLSGVDWAGVPGKVLDVGDRFLCARDWKEAGALAAARPLLRQVLETVRRGAQRDPDEGNDAVLAMVLAEARELESELGAMPEALRLAQEEVELSRAGVAGRGSPEDVRDLAVALLSLADLQMALDDPTGSRASCEESLRLREALIGDPPDLDALRDVSVALDQLGHLYRQDDDDQAAERAYGRSLEIARKVVRADSTPQSRRDLTISLMNMADVVEDSRGHEEALELLEEALIISRRLAEDDARPETQDDLAHLLGLVADTEAALERFDAAWEHFEESLGIARALHEASPTPGRRRMISTTLSSMSNIARQRDDLSEAMSLAREALELDREAVEELRTSKSMRDLGVGLVSLARLAELAGEDEEAIARLRESIEVRKEVLRMADRRLHREDLWMSHRVLARVTAGRRDAAITEVADDWLDFFRSLGREGSEYPVGPLAAALAHAAMIDVTSERADAAGARAGIALGMLALQVPEADDPATLEFSAHLLANAVIAVWRAEDGAKWAEARPFLGKALKLANILNARLVDGSLESADWWDAIGCCITYRTAEEYFATRGDTESAERAAARVRRWESVIEDL